MESLSSAADKRAELLGNVCELLGFGPIQHCYRLPLERCWLGGGCFVNYLEQRPFVRPVPNSGFPALLGRPPPSPPSLHGSPDQRTRAW